MVTSFSFQLVEGTYLPSEAKKILMTLLHDKINYHEREAFSTEERFGIKAKHSLQRIEALQKVVEEVLAQIEIAQANEMDLVINGTLSVELVKASQSKHAL